MARLANLGTPFGSPGGIINIPAPAGAALAGQIQMQQLDRLGQSLGFGLGRREQGRLEQEDLRRMLSMPQTQDIYGTMYGARGMPAPQAQMPQMQSRRFQEMQTAGLMNQMFADPLEREYLRERISATKALTEQRREPETLEDKYKFWLDRRARAEGRDPLTGLLTGTRNEGDLELIDKKLAVIRNQFDKREEIEKRAAAERLRKAKLPIGKLDVKRVPPVAPRPYLNKYWSALDKETKSLVTKAILRGAKQTEILNALRLRGAIK